MDVMSLSITDKSRKRLFEVLTHFINDEIPSPEPEKFYSMRVSGFNAFMGTNYISVWREHGIVDMYIADVTGNFYDDYIVEFTFSVETIEEMKFYML